MQCKAPIAAMLAALLLPLPAKAQDKEATAKSRVVSVGLFKNGLAVVRREVTVPGPGTYRLDTAVEPVHGTFWVESNGKVEAAVKIRDVERPSLTSPMVNLQEELGGKKVTIHFKNDKLPPMSGTLVKIESRPSTEPPSDDPQQIRERFYILQTAKGRLYVNPGEIAAVLAEDAGDKVTQRKPVLVLTVEKGDKKPTVFVTYLAHGLAWAPSYLVDVTDKKALAIEMATVVRNEMDDIDGAEFRLISGFPSVEFANVISPLAARMKWETFFQSVQNRGQAEVDVLSQQKLVLTNAAFVPQGPRFKLGANPEGEGVDLHFESIGKRSLLKGEAFSLTVGKAKSDYERIVEWDVASAGSLRKYASGGPTGGVGEMWDVLHFKNPFKFPMTTAPAMIVQDGKFNGQRTSYWTNSGEEARLRVTRSLSVRGAGSEQEEGRPNESVVVDGRTYTRIFLKGELLMNNHRKEVVKMHVSHAIHGQIVEIDGNPRVIVGESSLQDVNRTHLPHWVVTLQPGEEKRLTYKYSVLVQR